MGSDRVFIFLMGILCGKTFSFVPRSQPIYQGKDW